MPKPAQNNVLVELHVADFDVVKKYYSDMGFKVVWEQTTGDAKSYLVMSINDNILCFWPGNNSVKDQPYFRRFPYDTKRGYGIELVIMVEDIEAYYNKVKSFANIVEEMKRQPWGIKDFRVEDPNGYYLRFTEPHNILDKSENAAK